MTKAESTRVRKTVMDYDEILGVLRDTLPKEFPEDFERYPSDLPKGFYPKKFFEGMEEPGEADLLEGSTGLEVKEREKLEKVLEEKASVVPGIGAVKPIRASERRLREDAAFVKKVLDAMRSPSPDFEEAMKAIQDGKPLESPVLRAAMYSLLPVHKRPKEPSVKKIERAIMDYTRDMKFVLEEERGVIPVDPLKFLALQAAMLVSLGDSRIRSIMQGESELIPPRRMEVLRDLIERGAFFKDVEEEVTPGDRDRELQHMFAAAKLRGMPIRELLGMEKLPEGMTRDELREIGSDLYEDILYDLPDGTVDMFQHDVPARLTKKSFEGLPDDFRKKVLSELGLEDFPEEDWVKDWDEERWSEYWGENKILEDDERRSLFGVLHPAYKADLALRDPLDSRLPTLGKMVEVLDKSRKKDTEGLLLNFDGFYS